MSLHALSWAMKFKAGSPAHKLILLSLANYADDEGRCWPSHKLLAEETELSKRTIIRGLADLEANGVIARIERRRENGSRRSDIIELAAFVGGDRMSPGGDTLSGGVVTQVHHGGDTVSPLEPSLNPQLEPKKDIRAPRGVSDRFEEFWGAYPRREGSDPKKPAKAKFLAACKAGHDPQAIIAGAKSYASNAPAESRFIPQARTWLNEARWEDYQPNSETVEKTGPPPGLTEQQQRDWERGWRPGMPSGEELSRRVNGKAVGDDREADRSERPDHGGKLLASGTVCHAPDWI